jgi:hypothetical protein
MSPVLSALVVFCALAASGALLVQLAVSESRRSRRRGDPVGAPAAAEPLPPGRMDAPPPRILEERVVPPPVPVARPEQALPVARAQPAVWMPTLSPDGAWLWTGSAWVPAWWGGPTVPPPPPYAVAAPPPVRTRGCAAGFGAGCAVMLGSLALTALAVLVVASRLSGG